MNHSICASVAVCSLIAVSGGAMAGGNEGDLLYDIDFSAPFHTGGSPVSIDQGAIPREGFSGYFLTDPADEAIVDDVFALRAMSGGVARFTNGAQAALEVESGFINDGQIPGADYEQYVLEFNAAVNDTAFMTVFLDSPAINRITFTRQSPGAPNGTIYYGSSISGDELAPYSFGELLVVRMTLDIAGQRWMIEVDGETLYQGALQNPATELSNVRFSISPQVILDNVTLRGINPTACGVADLNDDGILDLQDVSAFVTSFLAGCTD